MIKTNMLQSTEAMILVYFLSFSLIFLVMKDMVGWWIPIGIVYIIFKTVVFFNLRNKEKNLLKTITDLFNQTQIESINVKEFARKYSLDYEFALKTLKIYKKENSFLSHLEIIE